MKKEIVRGRIYLKEEVCNKLLIGLLTFAFFLIILVCLIIIF
jgi:hypothetical protein